MYPQNNLFGSTITVPVAAPAAPQVLFGRNPGRDYALFVVSFAGGAAADVSIGVVGRTEAAPSGESTVWISTGAVLPDGSPFAGQPIIVPAGTAMVVFAAEFGPFATLGLFVTSPVAGTAAVTVVDGKGSVPEAISASTSTAIFAGEATIALSVVGISGEVGDTIQVTVQESLVAGSPSAIGGNQYAVLVRQLAAGVPTVVLNGTEWDLTVPTGTLLQGGGSATGNGNAATFEVDATGRAVIALEDATAAAAITACLQIVPVENANTWLTPTGIGRGNTACLAGPLAFS